MLAYQAVAGEPPYRARKGQHWMAAQLGTDPIPLSQLRPGVSPDLEDLLLRCLAAEPRHRPRAQDVVRQLGEMESRGTSSGESSSTAKQHRPPGSFRSGILRRRIPHIVSATFGAGVIFLGLVMAAVGIERLPDARGGGVDPGGADCRLAGQHGGDPDVEGVGPARAPHLSHALPRWPRKHASHSSVVGEKPLLLERRA